MAAVRRSVQVHRPGKAIKKETQREKIDKRRESAMEEKKASGTISADAKDRISERLSSLENLYFPRCLQSTATDPSQRKSIFLDLLSRDVALFLERYGSQLTCDELREFDALKDDYEINWHLKHLWSIMSPTSEELRMRSVTVKNRRRAYLDKLMCDGNYFSEDAMREREPYLHHEYVGKFQDQSGRGMARPGERWSETLMRRSEEAMLVAKIRGEQQRLGVAERDWIGNERIQGEEEEEEEEEEGEEEEEDDEEKRNDSGNARFPEVRHSKFGWFIRNFSLPDEEHGLLFQTCLSNFELILWFFRIFGYSK